jgi:hypothetical protein
LTIVCALVVLWRFCLGFWIRIHYVRIRIRIRHFQNNLDPDPEVENATFFVPIASL